MTEEKTMERMQEGMLEKEVGSLKDFLKGHANPFGDYEFLKFKKRTSQETTKDFYAGWTAESI